MSPCNLQSSLGARHLAHDSARGTRRLMNSVPATLKISKDTTFLNLYHFFDSSSRPLAYFKRNFDSISHFF